MRVARKLRFDLGLEVAARDVNGAGDLRRVHLVQIANVEEVIASPRRCMSSTCCGVTSLDARLRFGHQLLRRSSSIARLVVREF